MANHNRVGQWAENIALERLQQAGFYILYTNYFSRFGEIDLIGLKQDQIVFVEVKARSPSSYGTSIEVISRSKQAKIIKTAEYFVEQHIKYQDYHFRFDVICIDLKHVIAKNTQPNFAKMAYDLDWIENAFTLD